MRVRAPIEQLAGVCCVGVLRRGMQVRRPWLCVLARLRPPRHPHERQICGAQERADDIRRPSGGQREVQRPDAVRRGIWIRPGAQERGDEVREIVLDGRMQRPCLPMYAIRRIPRRVRRESHQRLDHRRVVTAHTVQQRRSIAALREEDLRRMGDVGGVAVEAQLHVRRHGRGDHLRRFRVVLARDSDVDSECAVSARPPRDVRAGAEQQADHGAPAKPALVVHGDVERRDVLRMRCGDIDVPELDQRPHARGPGRLGRVMDRRQAAVVECLEIEAAVLKRRESRRGHGVGGREHVRRGAPVGVAGREFTHVHPRIGEEPQNVLRSRVVQERPLVVRRHLEVLDACLEKHLHHRHIAGRAYVAPQPRPLDGPAPDDCKERAQPCRPPRLRHTPDGARRV
mmetsp:Transcript_26691/g.82588  ORF Transcript_26691/g.82588 Transcript_26691/m.82588 type:complete len:399 (+) Transcript_26691:363-1559(+)